jgi:prolycopene isomerase
VSGTRYDAIIVGAGPGGLSAGLALAGRGWKVLIAEKNGQPGGNCTTRNSGGYTFDLAVHQLSGIGGGGMCGGILRNYGIADRLEFRRVDPFLVIDMPDRSYVLRGSAEEFRTQLLKDFPEDRADIDRMMAGLATLKQDTLLVQRLLYGSNPVVDGLLAGKVGFTRLLSFPFTFAWGLALRMGSDADSMLRRWVKNPRLRSVVHASWVYLGLPPGRISGVMMNVFAAMQHMEHTYYPVGGSQKLADVMAEAFRERDGELLLDSPVSRIIVEDGRARGVELSDGRTFSAPLIISNAAPQHTYGKLIDREQVPARFLEKLGKLKCSVGPFRVCLGLDYDVAEHGMAEHEYMFYGTYDHAETGRAMERGDLALLSAYSPSRISPGLAPAGHSTLILTTLLPWHPERDWRAHKDEIAAEMIAMIEKKKLPGLSKHIVVKGILTPADLEKLTNSAEGAMYGWANTPDQVLSLRLSMRSPIDGLYHVGHWTRPGTGVTTAIMSGWMLGDRLNSWVGKVLDKVF